MRLKRASQSIWNYSRIDSVTILAEANYWHCIKVNRFESKVDFRKVFGLKE